MIKKGIVQNVQANGTWEGKFGLMYKFEVTIGDDTGQCLSKTDTCKFVIGEEVDYEFVGGQYPKIKYVNAFQQGGGNSFKPQAKNDNVQEMIVKQNSLTNATSFVCNNGGTPSDVLEIAEIFSNWVLKGEKAPKVDNSNDMPF